MAETVTMPKLGFDMAEGTLVRWVIGLDQEVKKGQVLAEIETDKATVEVESSYEGVLRKQLVNEGDVVPVGTPIAIIAEASEKVEDTPPLDKVVAAAETGAPGGATQKDEAGAVPGTENQVAAPVGEVKPKGEAAGVPVERGAPPEGPATGRQDTAGQEAGGQETAGEEPGLPGGLRASPIARAIAAERGVDLHKVKGTGPQGRIVKKDVEAFLTQPQAAAPAPAPMAAPAPQKAAPTAPAYVPGAPQADQNVALTRLRGAIGRRMTESKQQVPHFYVTHEYDVAELLELRQRVNAMLGENEKVSVNDFIVKAVALTLRQFPNLNAAWQGDHVLQYGAVNVGVAVATDNGLLTVVCRDADRKSLRQISSEVKTMAGRAREGKVKPEEIEGSTFSISNLGMFDVENFSAIINPPEAAILAVGSARQVPVVKDGQLAVGTRMKITISIDHRVSDGAEGARFMQALAQYLEKPMLMLV